MTAFTDPSPTYPTAPTIVDVWSRTTRRYRRRSVFMLALLALLFGGLCCFTFWLRTGHYWPLSFSGYGELMLKSFMPKGADQVTLSDFLTYPIDVQRVEIHGVVMGLLFSSLCSIPILVSILYRFPSSIIFAALVFFFAAMPWLGITVLGGCLLTSIRPFKLTFRYASALLGLLPVALYFVMATWEPAGSSVPGIQHRALLYAPWFLSLLGSCVIFAVALGIARVINYRPGGIPPVLAILFAVPVVIFHTQVGRDELVYNILEREIGLRGPAFRSRSVGRAARSRATELWNRDRESSYEQLLTQCLSEEVSRATAELEQARIDAVRRCDAFLIHYSTSRYVPSVFYLKGRALDLRLRKGRLVQTPHRAEYAADFPNARSKTTWETLVTESGGQADLAAAAMLQLGRLALRGGEMEKALDWLGRIRAAADAGGRSADSARDRAGGVDRAESGAMFRKAPASMGLGIDTAALVDEAARLEELIRACREDQPVRLAAVFGDAESSGDQRLHPLQLWSTFDHSHPDYISNLEALIAGCPESATLRYLEVERARLVPSVWQRITRLLSLAGRFEGRPAGAPALFHLADAYEEDSILDEARATLTDLVRRYPESHWSDEARVRLSSLTMLAPPAN